MSRTISFHCNNCEEEWLGTVNELNSGEYQTMVETCRVCELTYCGECYTEHTCIKNKEGK